MQRLPTPKPIRIFRKLASNFCLFISIKTDSFHLHQTNIKIYTINRVRFFNFWQLDFFKCSSFCVYFRTENSCSFIQVHKFFYLYRYYTLISLVTQPRRNKRIPKWSAIKPYNEESFLFSTTILQLCVF